MTIGQLLIPVLGIIAILAFVWRTGGLKSARLDAAAFDRLLGVEAPDFAPDHSLISDDGRLALALERGYGRLALAYAVGDRPLLRLLARGAPFEATLREEGERISLSLDLDDFTRPRYVLALPAARRDLARAWKDRLDAFAIPRAPNKMGAGKREAEAAGPAGPQKNGGAP